MIIDNEQNNKQGGSLIERYSVILPLMILLASGLFLACIVLSVKFIYGCIRNEYFLDKSLHGSEDSG